MNQFDMGWLAASEDAKHGNLKTPEAIKGMMSQINRDRLDPDKPGFNDCLWINWLTGYEYFIDQYQKKLI